MKYVYVGIDLGTVNSCLAVWNEKEKKAEIVETGDGKMTPSFVCYDPKSDRIHVGEGGMRNYKNFKSGIYDAKRFIGKNFSDPMVQSIHQNYPFLIQETSEGKVEFSFTHDRKDCKKRPEEVSTEILKYFKSCLESEFPGTKIKAVITVPAYFTNEQRLATRRAAQNADLIVLGLVKEPTAAALHFFNCNKDADGLTVVFDLGGGTFDVSVVERVGSNILVKCCDGDNFLGGRNFDEEILKELLEDFRNKNIHLDARQQRRLQNSIKLIKEKLSSKEKTNKEIDSFYEDGEDFILKLTRIKFEELNTFLFKKCIDIVDRCLLINNIVKSQVVNVVMVGGSTKIPKIEQMVRDYFGSNPVLHCINPDLSVALGAAAYAFNLIDPSEYSMVLPTNPNQLIIQETCSMNIGKRVLFELFHLVIERNARLPIKKTIQTFTSTNYQENISTNWYEGNYKCAQKNHYLGKIEHGNLPKRKAGEIIIEQTIEVDVDNILTITSKVLETNEIVTLTLPLYEKSKDVTTEVCSPGWTQKDDEQFEKLAIIKIIFYQYYGQFAFIRKLDSKTQAIMFQHLININDEKLLFKELKKFVTNYDNKKSECINLIKELLKSVKLPIGDLRNLKKNSKWNLES